MKTVKQIRKDNLKFIIDTRYNGVINRCAVACDVQQSQLSRVFAEGEYRRNVGEILARKIETKLSLATGWLDTEHAASSDISSKMDHLTRAQRQVVDAVIDEFLSTNDARQA